MEMGALELACVVCRLMGHAQQVPYQGRRFSRCSLQYALQRWPTLGLRRQDGDARGCRCTAALLHRLCTRTPADARWLPAAGSW
jgi:hypothetical protein